MSEAVNTMWNYLTSGRYELHSVGHAPTLSTAARVSSHAALVPKSQKTIEGIGTIWVVLQDDDDYRFAWTQLKDRSH